jgi:23S rRNA pseudouridine1911/1915/1917 synthase
MTLQDFLTKHQGVSKRLLTRLKRIEGGMTRDGKLIRSIDMVENGDEILLRFGDDSFLEPNPALEVPVAYESDSIIVFNKPSGMPVHPSIKHQGDTLGNKFAAMFPELTSRAVNRLDRDTSGVIAVAKDLKTKGFLQKQFQERHAHKVYYVIVEGEPKQPHAIINVPLTRNLKYPTTFIPDPDGREAITEYKVLDSKDGLSLIELKPKTGRTHQLRIHMNYIGCPILGDKVYNPKGRKADRMYLHAASLEITIPGEPNNIRKIFKADLPAEFNKFFEAK